MEKWLFIVALIVVIILVLAFFKVKQFKKLKEIRKNNPGYPKGHWMEQGAGFGVAIGAGIGVALGNIGLGVAIGVAIGTAIGSMWEAQHKDEIRPLTEEEKEIRKQTILFVLVTFIIGLIVAAVAFFSII